MATYTSIAASENEPLAPVTATLMDRLTNNPIAMFEGASGAPRLDEAARAGSVAGDTLLFSALGGTNSLSHQGVDASSPQEIIQHSHFRATTTCGLRCTAEVTSAINGGEIFLYKNGVEVTSRTTVGQLSADVSLVAGDTVWFEVRAGSGSGSGELVANTVAFRTGATRSCGGT